MNDTRQHPFVHTRSRYTATGREVVTGLALLFLLFATPAWSGWATADHSTKTVRQVRIVVTADMQGELLPTLHCSGEALGGLPRRFTFIRALRQAVSEAGGGGTMLLLDAGQMFGHEPDFPEYYAEFYMETLNYLGYDAFNLGAAEFQRGRSVLRHMADRAVFPLISSNVSGAGRAWQTHAAKTLNGVRIAVVGAMDPARVPEGQGWSAADPFLALSALVDRLKERTDLIVLLSQLDFAATLSLAEALPGVDIVVAGRLDVAYQGRMLDGRLLISPGRRGQTVAVIDAAWSPSGAKRARFAAALHPLDETFAEDAAVFALTDGLNAKIEQGRTAARKAAAAENARRMSDLVERARHMTPESFIQTFDYQYHPRQDQ